MPIYTNPEEINEEYNPLDKDCPRCGKFPLESQIFGYEKQIFCSHCNYSVTEEVQ